MSIIGDKYETKLILALTEKSEMNSIKAEATSMKSNIYIKNMVCNRCIMVVKQVFDNHGVNALVELGRAVLEGEIPQEILAQIDLELNRVGFEIINRQSIRLVEQIKSVVVKYVYERERNGKVNFSTFLASKLNKEYNYLSTLFSSVENTTIEHYMINLKVERAKELLVYDEKTLSEIAYELDYSSVAHLSGQFKKVTGNTPTYFKKLGEQKRKSINDV